MEDKQTFFHLEHKLWLRSLDFYQEEITFFGVELSQVMLKNEKSFSMLEYIEEYKTIFRKKMNHIAEIREAIMSHEKNLGADICEDHEGEHHVEIKTKFEEFVKKFVKLKRNFRRFASHND